MSTLEDGEIILHDKDAGPNGEQDYAVLVMRDAIRGHCNFHIFSSSEGYARHSIPFKDMKVEVTNHRSSSNVISVIVNGKCILSRFLKPYPSSVLTTSIDHNLSVIANGQLIVVPSPTSLKPKVTFPKYAPPAKPSSSPS